jgi:hypothetical protein
MKNEEIRQVSIPMQDGSDFANFYQEEARQRGISVADLIHDLLKERYQMSEQNRINQNLDDFIKSNGRHDLITSNISDENLDVYGDPD